MLSKFTTPLSIPRGLLFISTSHARPRHSPHLVMLQSSTLYPTPLRNPRHRQRYATTPPSTPQLYAIHDAFNIGISTQTLYIIPSLCCFCSLLTRCFLPPPRIT
ncbi:hypothetical protein Pcinc_014119 [Petrolisthes cinctipes]|uniref:Uncharacterized protein n=1 Tax=Petrolisthes cinctipes TaxID=88211 RepID=A0AAE1KS38_PETCI|nr:hypothetical protein Pcinc_014108 [Petrolisthes cinctipes]KAK3881463.1 hypothetical protein Pcinc_014119 [Petrolisthes cinctipes]